MVVKENPDRKKKVFCFLLLCRNVRNVDEIIRSNPIDLVVGVFNNTVLHDYQLQLDFQTHLDAGILGHLCLHNDVVGRFSLKRIQKCVKISDHDETKNI